MLTAAGAQAARKGAASEAGPGSAAFKVQASKTNTDEFGDVALSLSGRLSTESSVSDCTNPNNCHLQATAVGAAPGLQTFEQYQGLTDVRIHFDIVSARVDRKSDGSFALDLQGKVDHFYAKQQTGSAGDCKVGARVGITVSKDSVSFNCGGNVIVSYGRKIGFNLTGSAVEGVPGGANADLKLTILFQGAEQTRDETTDALAFPANTPKTTAHAQSGSSWGGDTEVTGGAIPAGYEIYVDHGPQGVLYAGKPGPFDGVTEPAGFGAETDVSAFVCVTGGGVGKPLPSKCLTEGAGISIAWAA